MSQTEEWNVEGRTEQLSLGMGAAGSLQADKCPQPEERFLFSDLDTDEEIEGGMISSNLVSSSNFRQANAIPIKEIAIIVRYLLTRRLPGSRRPFLEVTKFGYVANSRGQYSSVTIPSEAFYMDGGKRNNFIASQFGPIQIHLLLWRFQNRFQPIPEQLDISHLHVPWIDPRSGEALDEKSFTMCYCYAEDRATNLGRCACHKNRWWNERRDGYLRCPHDPPCVGPWSPEIKEFLHSESYKGPAVKFPIGACIADLSRTRIYKPLADEYPNRRSHPEVEWVHVPHEHRLQMPLSQKKTGYAYKPAKDDIYFSPDKNKHPSKREKRP